jgi:catechol 2,3-dioxygenase-like lactoylglutathione lyase family enzyme
MSTNFSNTSSTIKFGRIAVTIPVTDMEKSLQFYVDLLGFEKTFENGNPVGFAILKRDSAELHLTYAKNHQSTDRNLAHIFVSDINSFHSHLVKNNVRIIKGLREVVPGMNGFVFADPDGNRIDIGSS